MKIASVYYETVPRLAAVTPDEKILSLDRLGFRQREMQQLIETADEIALKRLSAAVRTHKDDPSYGLDPEKVKLRSPLRRPQQDFICLGLNYREHAAESAKYQHPGEKDITDRDYPVYFSKRATRCVGHGEPVNGHFDMVEALDYEVELAVIIGKRCHRVPPEEAGAHIFGYTIANDISARRLQNRYKQWYFGKSLDDFAVLGPWIVTADEISYPPALPIRSYVNGELRQEANTGQMLFSVSRIISELSRGMTLEPGTVILTGTPAGVGFAGESEGFLRPGDRVRCEIDGIGVLENEII